MKTIPVSLLTKVNLDALREVYQGQVMLSLLPADAQVLWDILQAVGLSHVPEIDTGDGVTYVTYEGLRSQTEGIPIGYQTNLHRWCVVDILSTTHPLHDSAAAKQWVCSPDPKVLPDMDGYYSVTAINHPENALAAAIQVARNCALGDSTLAAVKAAFRCRVLLALADCLPEPTNWRYPE